MHLSDVQWVLFLLGFMIGILLFTLKTTVTANVQPAIVNEFQSVDKLSWLITSALLPTTGNLRHPHADMSSHSPIWAILHDLSSKVVLYLLRTHIWGRRCVMRRSTEYGRLDLWATVVWHWHRRVIRRRNVFHLNLHNTRRAVSPFGKPN